MVLSGLALAFSRLIDDSVVVIENIYRHIELGEDPKVAAVKGANEVALGGARHHAGRRGRFLSGHASLRRQQVFVLGAGAGRGARALRLLL